MPVNPFQSREARIAKTARYGNADRFSTGQTEERITAWEVWNSRVRMQTTPQTKIHSDETRAVFRTRNRLAAELETDDSFIFDGYSYSVQEVHTVKTALGLLSVDYEISVK